LLALDRGDAGCVFGMERVLDLRRIWLTLFGAGDVPAVPLTLIRRFVCGGLVHSAHARGGDNALTNSRSCCFGFSAMLSPCRFSRSLSRCYSICAMWTSLFALSSLQIANLLPELLQLSFEGANALTQRLQNSICAILSSDCGSYLALCALCVCGEVRERTAMFIGCRGNLLPERGEFGADIFYLVLCWQIYGRAPQARSCAAAEGVQRCR
jgi:hypothetical protein